ncbi:MAG: NUDIX domain-containing protein [Hyphomicrobiaceae bacterium]
MTPARKPLPWPLWQRVTLRVLQSYWRTTRGLTMGAQGIVLDESDRVLLVKHGYKPGWQFPGGGVERGETTVAALARELQEEVGVRLEASPQLIGIYANFAYFPSDHIALYAVRSWSRPVVPKPTREIVAQEFFHLDHLPEEAVGSVRRRLAELREGAALSPDW